MEKHIIFVLLSVALFVGIGCAQTVGDALYVGSQLQLNLNPGGASYVPSGTTAYASLPNLNWGSLSSVTLELRFWARTPSAVGTLFFYGNDTHYLWIGVAGNNPVSYNVILQDNTRQTINMQRINSQSAAWNYLSLSISQSQMTFYTTSWLDSSSTGPNVPDTSTTGFGANLADLAAASGGTGIIGYIPFSGALASVSSDAVNAGVTFGGLPALVDEIRVYTFSRSSSQVDSDKTTSFFNGTGLTTLYIFENDPEGASTFTDSISGQIATITGTSFVRNPAISSSQTTATTIVTHAIRKAAYNGATFLPLRVYKYFNAEQVSNPIPNYVSMCLDDGNSCTASLPSNISSSSLGTYFNVSVIPERISCGTTQSTFVRLVDSGFFNFTIYFDSFTPSASTTSISFSSTSGGQQQLSGSFGDYKDQSGSSFTQTLDGTLEKALMVYNLPASGTDDLTSSVSITSGGTQFKVTFTDTGKYGTGNLQITLCNQIISVPVAYPAPVVNQVVPTSYSSFDISGANFGSSSTWTGDISLVTVVQTNGTVMNCTVDTGTNSDTSISCVTPLALKQNLTANFTVRVGDQSYLYSIPSFDPCGGLCQNGGECTGVNQCDCSQTLYEGDYCNESLSCFPACQHGGNCVRDPSNSTARICDCSHTSYSGSFCDQKSKSSSGVNTALVAGVTAGGGALLLILIAAVVILFLKRNKPRGGKNFIPLEKKDFTKIIYGEQLDQEPDKTDADISKLENMLTEDNLEIAAAISNMTQITEADKIAKALVVVFQAHDKVLTLLKAFIAEEVNTTESAGTLFRSNSMVSKMFKFYSRLIGLPYLYITIGPEVCELIEENLGLEVDPEKMEEGTDLDEMRWMLMAQSQKILKSILRSIEDCPPQFRILFNHIKTCVAERFPENINTTIGGFIFLRFFCPAISSPEAYGIIDEPPTPQARRLLILITKVLQNLSNDVEFGSKEPYMTKMNDFIHSNRDKLSEFYEKLIKPSSENPTECHLPKHMKAVSLTVIANHIQDNVNKVEDDKVKARLQSVFS